MKRFLVSLSILCVCSSFLGVQAKKQMMDGTQGPPSFMSNTVNDVLQSLTGDWTGTGTMMDMKTQQPMPWSEQVSFKPVLDNKFLHIDSTSPTSTFAGKGFMTYNAQEGKYIFYWFDTMGFGGKFEGMKTGNMIMLEHRDMKGPKLKLTFTLDNPNQYHMLMQSMMGHLGKPMTLVDVTYTRASGMMNNQNTNNAPMKY